MKTNSTGGRMRHELMTQGDRGCCFLEPRVKMSRCQGQLQVYARRLLKTGEKAQENTCKNCKDKQVVCVTASSRMIQTPSWKRLKTVVTTPSGIARGFTKNRRPFVPRDLAHSNHTFGELQITKNVIVTTATLAVRPPSGTTAETFEFQHSHEEIYDVHNPNTIWPTDCLQHIRNP